MASYLHDGNDLTVLMTSNTAPAPNVASASIEHIANYAYLAFNHANASAWIGTSPSTSWLKFDFGSGNAKAVIRYVLATTGSSTTRMPKDWTFQGSNDDSAWTTLDTITNETGWAANEMRSFSFSNSTAYRYYKVNITANNGDGTFVAIGELELFDQPLFYPGVGADDGGWYSTTLGAGDWGIYLGHSTYPRKTWIRFPNVTIPPNSEIKSAFVRLTAYNSLSGTVVNESLYFNDVDDAVAPTTAAGADALALTGAVAWNGIASWTDGNQYDSPELKTILQDIVSRGGWNSGNAVQVIGHDNSSTSNANRLFSAIDYSSGAEKAELHVAWGPPIVDVDCDVTNPSMTVEIFSGITAEPSIPQLTVWAGTGITAEPSIPMQTVIGNTSDDIKHIDGAATIPSMSADITQAASISGLVTIPSMTANITERESVHCNVSIPMMTANLNAGSRAFIEDVSIPMMSVEGLLSARNEVSIPMQTMDATVTVGSVIVDGVSIPMMTVNLSGKTEHLADIECTIPMARASAHLYSGKIITGSASIPMMAVEIYGHSEITGDIDVSIPAMIAEIQGSPERFVGCPVLRYEDP